MAEHTPGPWLYSGGYPSFVAAPTEDDGNAARDMVCNLDSHLEKYQRPQDEIDVNGWLIAAVPELLALAKAYEKWEADLIMHERAWRNPPDGEPLDLPYFTGDLWDSLMELQAKRNAAIGKAEGNS